MSEENITKCGYVAIIGRPNVGKSTLLNAILKQKISITSRKSQTTRHTILGIKTDNNVQVVYVDTPGIYKSKDDRALNRYMNKSAINSLRGVDVIVFVIEGIKWIDNDFIILNYLENVECPVILAINKIDTVKDRNQLLPFLKRLSDKFKFQAIIPISAKQHTKVNELEKEIISLLPVNQFYFPVDQVTDRNERFLSSEIIREKLMRLLGQEVPYDLTVVIENFIEKSKLVHINAIIYVEREGQKAIIIGKSGSKLKTISSKARLDIEKLLKKKVFLEVWVKVKPGWSNNENDIKNFGYEEHI